MNILSDWKFWVVVLATVLGTIAFFFYPQTKQDTAVIKQIEQSQVIVVFLPQQDWSKAEEMLWIHYDKEQYKLLEKFYDELRGGWWVKIEKQ